MTTEAAYGPMQKDVIETKKAQDGVQNGVQPEVTKRWRPFHDLRLVLLVLSLSKNRSEKELAAGKENEQRYREHRRTDLAPLSDVGVVGSFLTHWSKF